MATVIGTDGPETLDGTSGDDALYGLGGNDVLNGLGGNDYLDGGSGDDTLNGNDGNDIYVVDSSGDIVNELTGEGFDTVYALANYALGAAAYVELLSASDHSLTTPLNLTGNDHTVEILGNNGINVLTGGAGAETILGFGGADTLNGLGGNDYLDGGTGNDTLAGGTGDDVYVVDSASDTVTEAAGEGFDTVYAQTSYVLAAAASVERLSAVDHASTTAMNLTGSNNGTQILGNEGINTLTGGTGNDLILGFGGNDTLNGSDGNDALYGMAGFDTLSGGNGNDFLDGGDGGWAYMRGGPGNDIYVVHDSADITDERVVNLSDDSGGNDIVYTSVDYNLHFSEVETLAAVDNTAVTTMRLFGNNSANAVYGDAGNNLLDGRGGADYLVGYGGADIFNFSDTVYSSLGSAVNTPTDTIVDFQPGVDKIRLDSTKFVGVLGNASFFEVGTAATHAETRIIYDPATGALYYDQNGNDPPPPFSLVKFAQVTPGLALTAADFIVEANQAPQANNDAYAVTFSDHDVAVEMPLKQNDFDADGLRLWVTKIGVPGQPLVTVTTGLSATAVTGTYGFMFGGAKTGQFSYQVDTHDPDTMALLPGQSVTDTFVYEVTDGETDGGGNSPGGSFTSFALFSQATITVTITRALDGSVGIVAPKAIDSPPDNLAPPVAAFAAAHDGGVHAVAFDADSAVALPHPHLAILGMEAAIA